MNNDDVVRQSIVEAASRLFQRWGIHKTTMEDIAREAGKGKSTLYYYYKSKDEIFWAVAEKEIKEIIEEITVDVNREVDAGDKLAAYISINIMEIKKKINLNQILVNEVKSNNELMNRIIRHLEQQESRLLRRILVYGMDNKSFRRREPYELDILIYYIESVIRSVQLDLIMEKRLPETEEHINTLKDLILDGLRA